MLIFLVTLDHLCFLRHYRSMCYVTPFFFSFSPSQIKARNDEIRKIQSDLNNVERNQQEMLKRIKMETESAEISETKNSEGRR